MISAMTGLDAARPPKGPGKVAAAPRLALPRKTFGLLAGLWLALAPGALLAGGEEVCVSASRESALALVNATRAAGGDCGRRGRFAAAAPLAWSAALEVAAQRQAQWLVRHDDLVHTGPRGQTLSERAFEAGYRYARVTENLAQGQADLAAAVTVWVGSDVHCAQLFDAGISEMALACLPAADGRPLWLLTMGRPR